MQKNSKKASILIWSIFMSLLLGAIFITASIEMQNTIKENSNFSQTYKNNNTITRKLTNNTSETLHNIGDKEILKLESKQVYEVGFKQKVPAENISFELQDTAQTNIKIRVINGVITYEYNGVTNILDSETILTINQNIPVTITNNSGYSRVIIESNNGIKFPKRYYQVIKRVGPKEVVKTSGFIE